MGSPVPMDISSIQLLYLRFRGYFRRAVERQYEPEDWRVCCERAAQTMTASADKLTQNKEVHSKTTGNRWLLREVELASPRAEPH